MYFSDFGIILEIIGFIFLSLTAGRNTKGSLMAFEDHEEDILTKIRNRIVPVKFVISIFSLGFVFILVGLFFQFSFIPKLFSLSVLQ